MLEMLARPHLWSLRPKNAISKVYKPFFACLICVCSLVNVVFAQATKKITGKVTDEKGEALSGVSIKSKKSNNGTITDPSGLYSITVSVDDILSVSYTAFETKEIKVGSSTNYNIQLKSSTEDLGEIVVVGYGSQKKSSLTGAISTVTGKTLNELPVASIDQALQGRVAGISVVNNGSPGSSPVIAIRGISSINGSGDPLYVIDGFPTGSLNTFDSKDIESVEVLKDASAAAIYGSRGTNGVILITTKKGKRTGKLEVVYDAYAGIQSPIKKLDLLNTTQYVQYATALLGGAANLPPRLQAANFNKPIYAGATQTFAQTNTNWQDEYFKNNQLINQHNISIAGGNNISRFFTSAGYFKQNGIQQGLGYERGNFRINSEHKISKVFTFAQTLYLAFADQQYEGTGGNRSPGANVIRMQPYLPVRNPTNPGGFMGPISSFDGSDPTNPVEPAILNQYHQQQMKILGSASLEINLAPWLTFRSTFGVDYSNNLNKQYIPIYNDSGTINVTSATINHNRSLYTTLLYTQQLNFNKAFGDHRVGATLVFETQGQNASNYINAGNQDNNTVQTLNGATNISTNYTTSQNFIQSYVGRVTYSYKDKYLFNVAMRRDGLSIWAPGHKYGNFPSGSVGWRLDQEGFMKNVSQISELKLRAGYGLTGASPVSAFGNYPWQVVVNSNQSIYPFGGAIGGGFGSYINQLGNQDLFWETTKQFNIGMDLGLFRNKVTLVAEYFNRQTDNLILSVPTPPSNGFDGAGVNANVGVMRNRGFEFQAAYHKTNGNFKWDVTGLFSVIRNKVLALNTPNAAIGAGGDADFGGGANITNTVAGQPVQTFYGYVTDGIFQTQDQINKSPTQNGAAPGDIKFKDLNGDGKITDADRTYIGSYLPKFTYSLNYSANYKGFDASVFFQGVQGNKIFDGTRILTEGMVRLFNAGTAVLNAWTPTNTNTSIPRAINGDPNGNVRPSDRWIEDGSYLRLKNVIVGYNVPIAKLNSLTNGTITRIRLFVSSQNLITFTKYKGWDPEIGTRRTTLTNGIDYGQYPSARSFQFGLQVGF